MKTNKKPAPSHNTFRDRIKELRRVRAGDLIPCPWNWRQHPIEQREALLAILTEVGYAGACLARETEEGLELIDGHMRAEMDLDQEVPVLVLDVTEDEAKKLLATLDPLTGMATENAEAKRQLLEELDVQEASLRKMIAEMLAETEKMVEDEAAPDANLGGPPEMELRPHEHYDYVMVLARTTMEWNRLVELLELKEVACPGRTKLTTGIGRGIPARRLIELLEAKRG
jgi:hypothetical protein